MKTIKKTIFFVLFFSLYISTPAYAAAGKPSAKSPHFRGGVPLLGFKILSEKEQAQLNEDLLAGAYDNELEEVAQALKAGAHVNYRQYRRQTALHYIVGGSNLNMYEAKRKNTELLLAYKADINAQNVNGETPLMRSIIHSPNSITQLLLAAKADTEIEDEESNTVLKIALDSSQKSQLLIEWGAQLIPIDKMVHSQTIAQEKIYSSIFAKHEQEPSAEVIQYKTNLTQTLNPFIPVTVLAQLVVQYVPNLEIHIMLNQTRPQNPAPLPPISSKKYTIQHLMRQLCSHDKKTNAK